MDTLDVDQFFVAFGFFRARYESVNNRLNPKQFLMIEKLPS